MESPREVLPFIKQPTQSPNIFISKYSNVDVVELNLPDLTLMRRMSDGAVNATQLLKLAGLDRSKRVKVLEELGSYADKVQGGSGQYQGTYVPLDIAQQLASTYNVSDIILPLFSLDLNNNCN